MVRAYLTALKAPTLLIHALQGWPYPIADYEVRKQILIEKNLLDYIQLPGSHHLHLDPETSDLVHDEIDKFLAKVEVHNAANSEVVAPQPVASTLSPDDIP